MCSLSHGSVSSGKAGLETPVLAAVSSAPSGCLAGVVAKEAFPDLCGSVALGILQRVTGRPRGLSRATAEPWVPELCVVTWEESGPSAGGLGSGIWTWLNSVGSCVTLGKLFNLPQQSPHQVSSYLRSGRLLSGRVAVGVQRKLYLGRCPARPGGATQSVVTSLPLGSRSLSHPGVTVWTSASLAIVL